MTEIWEATFAKNGLLWGEAPAVSATLAADVVVAEGARSVLIPGFGYGRNAVPFLQRGLDVSGIEIAETAIAIAREKLGLTLPIHHGSVVDMPFSDDVYDAVFCYGLLYLLDDDARAKLLADCARQLAPGGTMIFTVLSTAAPTFGRGRHLGGHRYETHPGITIAFFDDADIAREFGAYNVVDVVTVNEPSGGGMPFVNVVCRPR